MWATASILNLTSCCISAFRVLGHWDPDIKERFPSLKLSRPEIFKGLGAAQWHHCPLNMLVVHRLAWSRGTHASGLHVPLLEAYLPHVLIKHGTNQPQNCSTPNVEQLCGWSGMLLYLKYLACVTCCHLLCNVNESHNKCNICLGPKQYKMHNQHWKQRIVPFLAGYQPPPWAIELSFSLPVIPLAPLNFAFCLPSGLASAGRWYSFQSSTLTTRLLSDFSCWVLSLSCGRCSTSYTINDIYIV